VQPHFSGARDLRQRVERSRIGRSVSDNTASARTALCFRHPDGARGSVAQGTGEFEVRAGTRRESAAADSPQGRHWHGGARGETGGEPPNPVPQAEGGSHYVRESSRRSPPPLGVGLSPREKGVGERSGVSRRLFRSRRLFPRLQT